MKFVLVAALFLAGWTASADAIILYRTGGVDANISEPTGDDANSGWQYEGNWSVFLGTPFAPHYFLSAAHIGLADTVFTFQSSTYHIAGSIYDPQGDLVIWKVTEEFSSIAPLYSRVDEVNQRVIAIGRGTQRGADVFLDTTLKGWRWGASDFARRWGENVIASIYANGANNDLLRATFDANGLLNECHFSSGDSGGAIFLNDGGVWKLAGINYSVDGHFSFDSAGTNAFDAALFDTSGLYEGESPPYEAVTGPSAFYATRISTKLPWICATVAETKAGLEGSNATITYTKLTLPPADVAYVVQQSPDLVSWTTASTTDEIVSTTGSSQVVKSKVALSPGDGAIFLRLQIARP